MIEEQLQSRQKAVSELITTHTKLRVQVIHEIENSEKLIEEQQALLRSLSFKIKAAQRLERIYRRKLTDATRS